LAKTEFDDSDLIAVLEPLEPYLPEIVICGGWTLYIYRKWVLKQAGPLPLRTGDVDVAVPKELPVQSEPLDKLLSKAGFREDPTGSGDLPIIHYIKKDTPFVEFLTPWRSSKGPNVVEIQKGVTAQVLQYLNIVLENPREVQVPSRSFKVRVPTTAAYLYQKGLSFPHRAKKERRAKDLAYLFELLNNFPELREPLSKELIKLSKRYPEAWLQTFRKNLEKGFSSIEAEGVADVFGQMPHPYAELLRTDPTNGRALFRQTVFDVFRRFLKEIG
jgi:hypothetical protein